MSSQAWAPGGARAARLRPAVPARQRKAPVLPRCASPGRPGHVRTAPRRGCRSRSHLQTLRQCPREKVGLTACRTSLALLITAATLLATTTSARAMTPPPDPSTVANSATLNGHTATVRAVSASQMWAGVTLGQLDRLRTSTSAHGAQLHMQAWGCAGMFGLVGGVNPHPKPCPPTPIPCGWGTVAILLALGTVGVATVIFALPETAGAALVVAGRTVITKTKLGDLRNLLAGGFAAAGALKLEVCGK